MAREKERSEIWWLARGYSRWSRQPSFAPSSARPVVSETIYGFGWHRTRQCFVTSERHDIFMPNRIKDYHCDPEVALRILRRCAYKNVSERFFTNSYANDSDIEMFAADGHLFTISISPCRQSVGMRVTPAEASIHFYSPDGVPQAIDFHDGMTRSFGRLITGLGISRIRASMSMS